MFKIMLKDKSKGIWLLLTLVLLGHQATGFFIHEEAQDLEDDSRISTIKIMYNDTITSTHMFPDSFWVEITGSEEGQVYKLEFGLVDDPQINKPVNLWKSDLDGKAYKLHREEKHKEHESSAVYQLVNSEEASGVVTLIRNGKNSNKESKRHRHLFRMIGSIMYENNFIEIVPFITKEQQAARKKRSADEKYEAVFDEFENSHKISQRSVNKDNLAESVPQDIKLSVDQANKVLKRKKRGVPLDYYEMEVLAVLDKSDFDLHKNYYQITDADVIHSYMRMYYSHMFLTVSYLFVDMLANTVRVYLQIYLTNMLFIEDTSMSSWTNANLIGLGGVQNSGRDLLNANLSLTNFANSMISLSPNLAFSYDVAFAIFNKDLFDQNGFGIRSLSYLNGSCTNNYKFAVVEDFGRALSNLVLAHEFGRLIGAENDGTGSSAACPASDNYIMTPLFGIYQSLQTNNYKFSTCSSNIIKANLKTKTCLNNSVKQVTPDFNLVHGTLQGDIFDANDQCKLYYGPYALFSQITDSMCTNLYCATSVFSTTYWSIGPAMDHTSCGSGKWCDYGSCVSFPSAPNGTCLYGDLNIPSPQSPYAAPCEIALQYYSSSTVTFQQLCARSDFASRCCSTCKKYTTISCNNVFTNCDSFKQYCGNPNVILNGGSYSGTVDKLCPVTCGTCTGTATCALYGSVCQNGATCTNNPNGQNGFLCNCPPGYYGAVCEYKTVFYNITGESNLYTTGPTLTSLSTTRTTSLATSTLRTTSVSGTCSCTCTTV